MTGEEAHIIAAVEAHYGRALTVQERNVAVEQARLIGELPQINGIGPGYKIGRTLDFDPNQPRDPAGSPTGGQWTKGGGSGGSSGSYTSGLSWPAGVRTMPAVITAVTPDNKVISVALNNDSGRRIVGIEIKQRESGEWAVTDFEDVSGYASVSAAERVLVEAANYVDIRTGGMFPLLVERDVLDNPKAAVALQNLEVVGFAEHKGGNTFQIVSETQHRETHSGRQQQQQQQTQAERIEQRGTTIGERIQQRTAEKSGQPTPTLEKKKIKPEDFQKAKITIRGHANKVIENWEKYIGDKITPEDFKTAFLDGLDSEMRIEATDNGFDVTGNVLNADGERAGEFSRSINLADHSAYSAYFKLERGQQNGNLGKHVLAGNIAIYQQLGVQKVRVSANIDVGGYAWAKYGYAPTQASWNSLRSDLIGTLSDQVSRSGGRGGNTYTPDSWEELSSSDQDAVYERWASTSFDEFYENEVSNWRDSGEDERAAAEKLDSNFDQNTEWAINAIDEMRGPDKAADDIPYTTEQLMNAITLKVDLDSFGGGYSGRRQRDAVEVEFDDDNLLEPSNAPPKEQMLLPGVEPVPLHAHLTEEMRARISDALTTAFLDRVEQDASDMSPPDYLADSVREYQSEYWDQVDETDRFRTAERHGLLPEYDLPEDDDEEQPEPPKSEDVREQLLAIARRTDPKALWQFADHPEGKKYLLGKSWAGVLDLTDAEALDRFNAYVGKAKERKRAA